MIHTCLTCLGRRCEGCCFGVSLHACSAHGCLQCGGRGRVLLALLDLVAIKRETSVGVSRVSSSSSVCLEGLSLKLLHAPSLPRGGLMVSVEVGFSASPVYQPEAPLLLCCRDICSFLCVKKKEKKTRGAGVGGGGAGVWGFAADSPMPPPEGSTKRD